MLKNLVSATCCTVALLSACTPPTVDPAVAPKAASIQSFTSSEASLPSPGRSVTLSWATSDATAVALEHVGVGPISGISATGSKEVTLERDGTFALTAEGEGGSDTRFVTVRVQGGDVAPPLFAAIPPSLRAGERATLLWSVPGATALTITPEGGAALDLGGQLASGSVVVTPGTSTVYTLAAGALTLRATVAVGPAIFNFGLDGAAPTAGQPVKLKWAAGGASKVTLFRQGTAAALATVTDAAQIAAGTFADPTPLTLSADSTFSYRLVAEEGTQSVEARVAVSIAGALRITSFSVPRYTRAPTPTTVDWATSGAESLELLVDGAPYYRAPTLALIGANSIALPTPTADRTVELVITNARGGRLSRVLSNSPVGAVPAAGATFTADKASIATGGEPVRLSWAGVTNARRVRVTDSTGRVLALRDGADLATGSLTVLPNAPTVTYTFDADNGTASPAFPGPANGDGIAPLSAVVTVTSPALLRFDERLPPGATVNVTGSTLAASPTLFGFAGQAKSNSAAAFVDISTTGTEITELAGTDTAAVVVTLPDVFNTRLTGRAVGGRQLSVASNGFIAFSATPVTGPLEPSALTGTGTNAIAAHFADLELARSKAAFWRLDKVGADPRLIVQWEGAHYFDSPLSKLTFQVQLFGSGKVVVAFKTVDVPSPVPGLVSFTGLVGPSTTRTVAVPAADLQVAAGDVFTLQAPALPQPYTVETVGFLVGAEVTDGVLDIFGDATLKPGLFQITEVNPRPADGGIDGGEWFEVTNFSTDPVNLKAWTLGFGGSNAHVVVGDLIIAPGARALLSQSTDLGSGAGPADYVYPANLSLPDTTGAISLSYGTSAAYSRIPWNTALTTTPGVSLQSDNPTAGVLYRSGEQQNACPATGAPGYGLTLQSGTPKAANFSRCHPYSLSPLSTPGFESIAATGTPVGFGSSFDDTVIALTLPSPVRLFGASFTVLRVSSNGWLSPSATATSSTSFNKTLPSQNEPVASVAPFWDDLQSAPASTDGGYGTVGIFFRQTDPDSTPNTGDETTLVSWENAKVFGTANADTLLNFQVKFLPNGDLEFHYGRLSGNTTTSRGSGATAWLEDRFGTSAVPIFVGTGAAPAADAGLSSGTSFKYTYTP